MVAISSSQSQDQQCLSIKLISWICNVGIDGLGSLPTAHQLSTEHLRKCDGHTKYAVISLLNNTDIGLTSNQFTTDFTLSKHVKVTLPAELAMSYVMAVNVAAAIADLYGYDTNSSQVRTMIVGCLIPGGVEEIYKRFNIEIGQKNADGLSRKLADPLLIRTNKLIGFQLLAEAEIGDLINFTRKVSQLDPTVSHIFNKAFVKRCGERAQEIFNSQYALLGY